jgi:hypothetical protein
MRLPRTTGAFSGTLIVLLGLWGALIPFVGPSFHYAFGGYSTWHYTSARLWLNIVPGAVAVIGGFMLVRASTRVSGLTAGWVALAAGVWFAVGPSVSLLWHHTIYPIGTPAGGYTRQMIEWVGYFYGLGAAIIALAAFAMGRFVSRPRIVEEPVVAAEAAVPVTDREAAYDQRGGAPAADRVDPARADAPATTSPAEPAPAQTAPAQTTPAQTAPGQTAPGQTAPAAMPPATTYRRRPGLMRRLRGQ